MNACRSGGFLTAAAALVAVQAAQGRSPDELALLGAFFTSLGDNLALMAAAQTLCAPSEQAQADSAPVSPA